MFNKFLTLFFFTKVFIIRPIVSPFYSLYSKYRWNDGICRKCNTGWWEDAYDDDLILKHRYRCDGCQKRYLYSTKYYEPLDYDEFRSKLRDIKLEKLLKK